VRFDHTHFDPGTLVSERSRLRGAAIGAELGALVSGTAAKAHGLGTGSGREVSRRPIALSRARGRDAKRSAPPAQDNAQAPRSTKEVFQRGYLDKSWGNVT
jgi:hypothetical protein